MPERRGRQCGDLAGAQTQQARSPQAKRRELYTFAMLKRGRPVSHQGFSARLQATGFLTHAFSANEARNHHIILSTAKYINPQCRVLIAQRCAIYGLSSLI
jgi:hypothetical protein